MEFKLELKIYIVLILVSILALLFYFFYPTSGQTEKLNKKNNYSKQPILKLYYTNWCGWSKKFLPVWNQLDKLQQIRIPMEKIDCEKNKEQCNGIPGFPYVVLEKNKERIEYKGNRTAKDIVNFVKTNV